MPSNRSTVLTRASAFPEPLDAMPFESTSSFENSRNLVPVPIISVKEHDLYIDGSGFWRRLRQFYLPVFVLTFEYLHEKEILHNSQSYITSPPVRLDFHSRISAQRRVKQVY